MVLADFGNAPDTPVPSPDEDPTPVDEPVEEPVEEPVVIGITVTGTDAKDKLFGTAGADVISDGAGVDNLYGLAGADRFVLAADGSSDAVKDFELGLDIIDLTEWGAKSLGSLDLSNHISGKVTIRYGSEVLSIKSSEGVLTHDMLSADNFVFAEGISEIVGTDISERLYGTNQKDVLIDGGGADNLYGRAGQDTFVLVNDGDADEIKDFETDADMIDLSAWNVTSFEDLSMSYHRTGKIILSTGSETLSLRLDAEGSVSELSADNFMF